MMYPAPWIHLDDKQYQADRGEYLTSHALADFRRDPALYWHRHIAKNAPRKDTPAFAFGRAMHVRILEGAHAFHDRYVVADGPINLKTNQPFGIATKVYAEWLEAQADPVISCADAALIERMNEAICHDKYAGRLLMISNYEDGAQGLVEGVLRAEISNIACQCRVDFAHYDCAHIVDIKSCDDLDKFHWQIRDFGYVEQLAFYAMMMQASGVVEEAPNAYLVAVEKQAPHRVAAYQVADIERHVEAVHVQIELLESYLDQFQDAPWPSKYAENGIIEIGKEKDK